ncbi:hypothetical protein AgCh_023729 [Apium graveolens]
MQRRIKNQKALNLNIVLLLLKSSVPFVKKSMVEEKDERGKTEENEGVKVFDDMLCECFIMLKLAQLANQNQLIDHYSAKHPKEQPPSNSE